MRKLAPATNRADRSSNGDAGSATVVSGNKLPYSLLRSVDFLSRCVASAGVLVLLVSTAWIILSKPSNSSSSLAKPTEALLGPEQTEQFLDGQWQFAGIPWSANVEQLSETEAMQRINLPPEKALALLNGEGDGLLQAFDILESLNATVVKTEFGVVYRVESDSFRLVGVAPASSPKSIRCVRLAQPMGDGNWNYVELASQANGSAAKAVDDHLLPLSDSSELATKRDSGGKLLAELISTTSSVSTVKKLWQNAGWRVHEAASGDFVDVENSAEFSEVKELLHQADGSRSTLICNKAESTIAVIAKMSATADSHTLLMFRLAQ